MEESKINSIKPRTAFEIMLVFAIHFRSSDCLFNLISSWLLPWYGVVEKSYTYLDFEHYRIRINYRNRIDESNIRDSLGVYEEQMPEPDI